MKILSLIIYGIFKVLLILGFVYLVCNNHPYMAIALLFCAITSRLEIKE